MLTKQHLFIIANFFIITSCIVAMEQITDIIEPQSVAYLSGKVAIAGKGCMIFDAQSRKPLCTITQKEVFSIAASKNKTLLALSTKKGILFHHIETGEQYRPADYITNWNAFIAFSSLDNTLFSRSEYLLYSYNYINTLVTKNHLPLDYCHTLGKNFTSCHPTKNEILYMSDSQELSIIQPTHNPVIKTKLQTNFRCVAGDYAPDGHTIALFNPENGQNNYFICNLEDQQNPLPAYQLIANDKDYCASAFDPNDCKIFLLSTDGYVHCFDYIKRVLIAATKKLSNARSINDVWLRKRLDCDQQGKHIIVALADTWKILDIPQNNFYAIWQTLCHHGILPKEIVKIIVCTIINSHKQSYEHFDLNALLSVMPIKRAICEQVTEDPMVLETETKKIQGIYVRQNELPIASKFCINTQRWDMLHNR